MEIASVLESKKDSKSENKDDFEAVNNTDIQKAVAEKKVLVMLTNSLFDPTKFVEFNEWDKHDILGCGSLDMSGFMKNTVLMMQMTRLIENVPNNVQLCYYHDRRYGCAFTWINSLIESGLSIIKITKPWQVTGNKPLPRRGSIELGKLYPKNAQIVKFVPEPLRGLVHSICVFYVEEDERLDVYSNPDSDPVDYKIFIKHVFQCYAAGEMIKLYHPIAAGIMVDVGMIRDIYFTKDIPSEVIKPCSNHNVKDIENGPPLFMRLNKRLGITKAGNVSTGPTLPTNGGKNKKVIKGKHDNQTRQNRKGVMNK
jgi:hypothetical protein